MNHYSFATLCFAYGSLLTAIFTFARSRNAVSTRFLWFNISIWGWGSIFSIWINQHYPENIALILARVAYVFVMFIPTTWLHFVFEFIGRKEPFKNFFKINYAISCILSVFCPTKWMLLGMAPFLGYRYLPVPGPMHHFHIIHYTLVVFYGLYCLVKSYLRSEGLERTKKRFFVIGTVLGFTSGSTIYLSYYRIPFSLELIVLLPLYPLFSGIALIRHELFEIQKIADAFQREKLVMVGTLAASLNHELRNPLFIALGRVETYKDAVERKSYASSAEQYAKADEVIGSVSSQLVRATDIMQRFLDFVKPAPKHRRVETVSVADLAEEVLGLIAHEIRLRDVELRRVIDPEVSINVSKREMEEVLFNLILNGCQALKNQTSDRRPQTSDPSEVSGKGKERGDKFGAGDAGHRKTGLIEIGAEKKDGKITLTVKDNGPGIPENLQKQIFEPFYTSKQEGTGLGLYITQQLVERNGGKISVQSKVGQGTTFVLEFRYHS